MSNVDVESLAGNARVQRNGSTSSTESIPKRSLKTSVQGVQILVNGSNLRNSDLIEAYDAIKDVCSEHDDLSMSELKNAFWTPERAERFDDLFSEFEAYINSHINND